MSTQGGTLQRRGTIELPIWPMAVIVVVAIAAAIGMSALGDAGQTGFVTSVSDSERFANSTAAVREQGAALPVIVGISHVAPSLHGSVSATIGTEDGIRSAVRTKRCTASTALRSKKWHRRRARS